MVVVVSRAAAAVSTLSLNPLFREFTPDNNDDDNEAEEDRKKKKIFK